ncbi:hypothetical protein FRC00_002411, partial [Tulasnella sp. 408]
WTAEAYLGEKVNHPVVAVPAYFNDAQRRLPRTPDPGRAVGVLRWSAFKRRRDRRRKRRGSSGQRYQREVQRFHGIGEAPNQPLPASCALSTTGSVPPTPQIDATSGLAAANLACAATAQSRRQLHIRLQPRKGSLPRRMDLRVADHPSLTGRKNLYAAGAALMLGATSLRVAETIKYPNAFVNGILKAHTGSRGRVKLAGPDPQDKLEINKNEFVTQESLNDSRPLRFHRGCDRFTGLRHVAHTAIRTGREPVVNKDDNNWRNDEAQGGSWITLTKQANGTRLRDRLMEVHNQNPRLLKFAFESWATKVFTGKTRDNKIKASGVEALQGANFNPVSSKLPDKGKGIDRVEETTVFTLKKPHVVLQNCTFGYDPAKDPCLAEWFANGRKNLYAAGAALYAWSYQSSRE